MANRPVFLAIECEPFYLIKNVEYEYFPGSSDKQNQRCINSLHEAFNMHHHGHRILEISSKSELELGVGLSAFNLRLSLDNYEQPVTVECAYQGGKIFENGGPYTDLLCKSSKEAKKDDRLKSSGRITGFRIGDKDYIDSHIELFYSWLYINALVQNPELAAEVVNYDAFTDLFFNPKKGISCQARSAAIFVGLSLSGKLDEATSSFEDFRRMVLVQST